MTSAKSDNSAEPLQNKRVTTRTRTGKNLRYKRCDLILLVALNGRLSERNMPPPGLHAGRQAFLVGDLWRERTLHRLRCVRHQRLADAVPGCAVGQQPTEEPIPTNYSPHLGLKAPLGGDHVDAVRSGADQRLPGALPSGAPHAEPSAAVVPGTRGRACGRDRARRRPFLHDETGDTRQPGCRVRCAVAGISAVGPDRPVPLTPCTDAAHLAKRRYPVFLPTCAR